MSGADWVQLAAEACLCFAMILAVAALRRIVTNAIVDTDGRTRVGDADH